MTFGTLPFNAVTEITKGLERDAMKEVLKNIAKDVCSEDCPSYLAIAKRYRTESTFVRVDMILTILPFLCKTLQEAISCLRPYDGGFVLETRQLKQRVYCCFSEYGACHHCERSENGALICTKGHGYPNITGCADSKWEN